MHAPPGHTRPFRTPPSPERRISAAKSAASARRTRYTSSRAGRSQAVSRFQQSFFHIPVDRQYFRPETNNHTGVNIRSRITIHYLPEPIATTQEMSDAIELNNSARKTDICRLNTLVFDFITPIFAVGRRQKSVMPRRSSYLENIGDRPRFLKILGTDHGFFAIRKQWIRRKTVACPR